MVFSSQVSIVGGGIGGLTTALSLAQRDIPVTLFEQSAAFREVGAGIQISPNASSVLNALGLLEQAKARAVTPGSLLIRQHKSFTPLAAIPLQHAADNMPYLHLHRADLIAVLEQAVTNNPLIQLQTDKRVERIEHIANGAALFTRQGERFASGWLVGADGIHSTIQPYVAREEKARFTGQTAWRALIPTTNIPEALRPTQDTHLWLGPHAHLVMYYVRGGELLNIVAVTEQGRWQEEGWTISAPVSELIAPFSQWHPTLRSILECTPSDQCFRWALLDRQPFAPWYKERVLVMGDAAHPTLPFLAQGAAMAMEDGWVFARLLSRHPQTAGKRFFHERFQRTATLQQRARQQAWIYHAHWLPWVMTRNIGLSLGHRFFPAALQGRMTRHFDWRPHE